MWVNLAWRLFKHEARRGELTVILFSIVLAVAAVLSLALFSERLQTALNERSAKFLAADGLLESSRQADPQWLARAQALELKSAYQIHARSMVFAQDKMSLVNVRATDPNYPLKGEIKIADQRFAEGRVTDTLPAVGEAWVESTLFDKLGIAIGDSLELGDHRVRVTRVLSELPDGGFDVFAINPKVLIRLQDLHQANILGPGSRTGHMYYFTGAEAAVSDFYQWLEPQLNNDLQAWYSVKDDESGLGESVVRAEQFFLLASLLAIILASVAIAVAAQRYSYRHYDPVAIMKTLGAGKSLVQRVYLLQVLLVTVAGIVLGSTVGYGVQQVVVWAIAEHIPVAAQAWYWRPVAMAVFTGFVCAVLFSVYPLLRLFSVPPLRVLRKDLGARLSSRLWQFIAAATAILVLMLVYSGNVEMSLILFGSGTVLILGLMLVTLALIKIGRHLGKGRMGAWQLAWARIQRRAMDNSVQLISFAITIMLLLMVLVMRNDMVQQWRDQLPVGTPNYFMVNISQDQLAPIQQVFTEHNLQIAEFYPVLRGRFAAVNGERVNTSVAKNDADDQQQRDGLGREANLTWSLTLQRENEIVAGQWLSEWQAGDPWPVSVEQEAAQRMQIGLGDELTFNVGSEVIQATVTSIRKVNWQTMQPNFFFVLHPAAMAGYSASYITSVNIPADQKQDLPRMMAEFGTVALIDVDARIDQLREIIEQVSLAVEFILVLVLIAGSLVLVAQVQASMDERQQELAILRTLGARGRLIRASVVFEFVILGVVAGLMAAIANELTLYFLQQGLFQMQPSIHWQYWLLAPAAGALVVGLLGAVSCWRLLTLNTTELLRRMV